MMRRRVGPPPGAQQNDDGGSSSDEDDVFAKLSRKQQKKKQKKNPPVEQDNSRRKNNSVQNQPSTAEEKISFSAANVPSATTSRPSANSSLPVATTSSMKRHHKEMSDTRKAKMDALLQELEQEKKHIDPNHIVRDRPPVKKGSFVEPGEEHITTNIFVGNLAPTLTEEEVTNLFRQFGRILIAPLYSIWWNALIYASNK